MKLSRTLSQILSLFGYLPVLEAHEKGFGDRYLEGVIEACYEFLLSTLDPNEECHKERLEKMQQEKGMAGISTFFHNRPITSAQDFYLFFFFLDVLKVIEKSNSKEVKIYCHKISVCIYEALIALHKIGEDAMKFFHDALNDKVSYPSSAFYVAKQCYKRNGKEGVSLLFRNTILNRAFSLLALEPDRDQLTFVFRVAFGMDQKKIEEAERMLFEIFKDDPYCRGNVELVIKQVNLYYEKQNQNSLQKFSDNTKNPDVIGGTEFFTGSTQGIKTVSDVVQSQSFG
jgi:hypothetical protein